MTDDAKLLSPRQTVRVVPQLLGTRGPISQDFILNYNYRAAFSFSRGFLSFDCGHLNNKSVLTFTASHGSRVDSDVTVTLSVGPRHGSAPVRVQSAEPRRRIRSGRLPCRRRCFLFLRSRTSVASASSLPPPSPALPSAAGLSRPLAACCGVEGSAPLAQEAVLCRPSPESDRRRPSSPGDRTCRAAGNWPSWGIVGWRVLPET